VPGADTLLRGVKELATENEVVVSSGGKQYQFSINMQMNRLNVESLLLTKQLKKGEYYDFDYDNQIIEQEKYDAKRTYKKNTGYFPGVATIGEKIVYVENRDGNANVKTGQAATLGRAYGLLGEKGIKVNRSRMDAGSYAEDIVEVIDMEDSRFRLVVMREKNADGQADLFTGDDFIYRSILTNDHVSTEKEVVEYYNGRGASEKTFDIQNNDFGWGHLPCSDMRHNTVYLILTAMIKNFYNYFIAMVSKAFDDIPATSRLKKIIFRFITENPAFYNHVYSLLFADKLSQCL
jgi:hypothetical protein